MNGMPNLNATQRSGLRRSFSLSHHELAQEGEVAMFRVVVRLTTGIVLLTTLLAWVAPTSAAHYRPSHVRGGGGLNQAFAQAAKEFDVPRDVLVAVAFSETHLDDHGGNPSIDNGYGVMHLVENPQIHTLSFAAKMLGISERCSRAMPSRTFVAALRFFVPMPMNRE